MRPPLPELPVRRRWVLLAILLGVALHLPSLTWGLYADDYTHELVLAAPELSPTMGPLTLYEFGAKPEPGSELWGRGVMPWWTAEDWEVRFRRPLASLSRALDSLVWGERVWGMHLTGVLLFALLEALVFALFRALGLSPRAALFGLVVFACEDGASLPVGWLAQRNSLVAVVLMVAALVVAARGRGAPAGPRAAFALGLGLLACLGKESGVVTFALLGALALWRWRTAPADTSRRAALVACAQALACAALFLAAYRAGGYGAHSLFYPEPWAEPGAFLARAAVLLPTGLLALAAPLSLDALFLEDGWAAPAAWVAAPVVLVLGGLLWRRVRWHPAASFLLAWTLLALLPQAGAPISDRLLFGASIGSAGLLGLWLAGGPDARAPASAPGRFATAVVLVVVVGAQAVSLLGRGALFAHLADVARADVRAAEVGAADEGPREALVLQFPSSVTGLSFGPALLFERDDATVRTWPMQLGRRGLRLTRVDARTLDLTSTDEPLLAHPIEGVFLTSREPPPVGATFPTSWLEVEVREVDDHGVRTIRVRTPDDLDAPHVRLLAWRDGALRRFEPPAVGGTATIPAIPAPFPLAP